MYVDKANNLRVGLCSHHDRVALWAMHEGARRPFVGAPPHHAGWYMSHFCQQGGHMSPADYFDMKPDGTPKRWERRQ